MRKVILIVVFLIAAVMVAAAVWPFFIPTESYRRFVENKISRHLDARVTMEGFRLRLIPYPGYTIRGLGLISATKPFRGMRALWAKKVSGSLAIGGLLRGRVETALTLHHVQLDYRVQDSDSNIGSMLRLGSAPGPQSPEEPNSVVIKSLEVKDGRLNLFLRDDSQPEVIDGIKLEAENLFPAKGTGAEVKLAGVFQGAEGTGFSAAGRVFYDPSRRELTAQEMGANLAGSRLVTNVSINFGVSPISFNFQAATPALTPKAVAPVMPRLVGGLLEGLDWQGQMAADVSLMGTKDAFWLKLQLDATSAGVSAGQIFSKGVGLPLKLSSSLYVRPKTIDVRQASVTLSDDTINVTGQMFRNKNLLTKVLVSGDDLDTISLKPFFPRFWTFGSTEGLGLNINLEGELKGEKPVELGGSFSAKRLIFAGQETVDVKGTMVKTKEHISFPTVRGIFADGQLSGHGRVVPGTVDKYRFAVVVDRLDAGALESIRGLLEGQGSLVVEVQGQGADPETLSLDLKLDGSFILGSGTLTDVKMIGRLFSPETKKALEEQGGTPIEKEQFAALADIGGLVEGLRASFELSQNRLSISQVTWRHPKYQASLQASLERSGLVAGGGDVTVAKDVAMRLVRDAKARQRLLSREGQLVLPVALSGTRTALAVGLDRDKLNMMVASRGAPPPPAMPPAKVVRGIEEPAVKERPAATERRAEGEKVSRRAKPPPKRRRAPARPKRGDEMEAEDILRVIIGR